MQEIFELVGKSPGRIRPSYPGESGTGKDLIAKTIHYNSQRKDKPLVTVHCGALTDTLSRANFSGMRKVLLRDHQGQGRSLSDGDGGTLVLDEIGEVPLHLQKTLLRVIEYKEFERVGIAGP